MSDGQRQVCDVVVRWIPGAIWWRLAVSLGWRRGPFEPGCGPMYGGLVYRWAWRVGPVNVAVLRLR